MPPLSSLLLLEKVPEGRMRSEVGTDVLRLHGEG